MAPSRRAPPRAVTAAPAPKISKAVDSFRSVKKNAGRGAAGKGKAAQVVESPVSVSKSSAVRESSPARTILGEVLPKGKRISGVLDLVPGTNDEGEAAAEEPAGLAEAPKPPSVRKRAPKSGLTRAEQRQIAAAIKASAAAEGKAADAPVDQAAEEEEEEAAGGEEGDGDAVMSISEAEHSPSSEDQHATAHTGGSSAAQPAAAPAACAQPVVLGAMAPPTAIAGLAGKWVGREEETARLVGLLGAPGVMVPPILVTGHAATGKTLVVRGVLKELGLKHAYINAVETATPRQLFEEVLNQLYDHRPSATNGFAPLMRCNDAALFLHLLAHKPLSLCAPSEDGVASARPPALKAGEDETRYIVIDSAERLCSMDAALLPVLLRIAQLSARNVCTILVSSAARQTFEPFLTARPALRLHFPPYSRIAIARILAHDASSNPARAEEYTEIAKVALNVFWGQCRALPELRQVAWQLCEAADHDPAVSSAAREKDSVKLFRALRPALRQASSSSSSSGPSAAQDAVTSAPEDPSSSSTAEGGASASGQTGPPRETRGGGLEELGLPLYSKHLLIAAFLASYSPPARDVATFSLLTTGPMRRKKRGGVHKVVPTGTKAQREGDLLNKPPGVFGLERLLAIFHTIAMDHVDDSADLLSQVMGLVTLGLVRISGGKDARFDLSDPKFVCMAPYSLVKGVAADVRVDIGKFVYQE